MYVVAISGEEVTAVSLVLLDGLKITALSQWFYHTLVVVIRSDQFPHSLDMGRSALPNFFKPILPIMRSDHFDRWLLRAPFWRFFIKDSSSNSMQRSHLVTYQPLHHQAKQCYLDCIQKEPHFRWTVVDGKITLINCSTAPKYIFDRKLLPISTIFSLGLLALRSLHFLRVYTQLSHILCARRCIHMNNAFVIALTS